MTHVRVGQAEVDLQRVVFAGAQVVGTERVLEQWAEKQDQPRPRTQRAVVEQKQPVLSRIPVCNREKWFLTRAHSQPAVVVCGLELVADVRIATPQRWPFKLSGVIPNAEVDDDTKKKTVKYMSASKWPAILDHT